jgi:6-phosphofructokinase 1
VGALGDALADLVKKNMKVPATGKPPRTRADTFGYLQRCWPDPSPIDSREAREAARFAVACAAAGHVSGSVSIVREKGRAYRAGFRLIALSEVAARTRVMPPEFLRGSADVSRAFIDYVTPLVGKLPVMERL